MAWAERRCLVAVWIKEVRASGVGVGLEGDEGA